MSGCFWTDFVGCAENCVQPLVNLVGLANGDPNHPNLLSPNSFGDVGYVRVPLNTVWSPTQNLQFEIPCRMIPRPDPDNNDQGCGVEYASYQLLLTGDAVLSGDEYWRETGVTIDGALVSLLDASGNAIVAGDPDSSAYGISCGTYNAISGGAEGQLYENTSYGGGFGVVLDAFVNGGSGQPDSEATGCVPFNTGWDNCKLRYNVPYFTQDAHGSSAVPESIAVTGVSLLMIYAEPS